MTEPAANPAEESITISRPFVLEDRTVMVDTNYLTQLNAKDLMSMLFDKNYENSLSSQWKKQMSKLFRDALGGRIDLCFSNLILREFIGLAPRRADLVDLYKRYISVVEPRKNLESDFFDLAAAINAIAVETGEESDVKDTYSYILAALAHVRYFVTGDKDIRRLYAYLIAAQSKVYSPGFFDIERIGDAFGTLSKTSHNDFPLTEIIDRLYQGPLPTPISILDLKNALADVLTKTETMLAMFTSLSRLNLIIGWMIERHKETPRLVDARIYDAATARIESVAKDIGISTDHRDAEIFRVALIEKESVWTQDSGDATLAAQVATELEILQEIFYAQEERDYRSLEEEYRAKEPTKSYFVKCEKCEEESKVETEYQGVVEVEQRSMGSESTHVWSGNANCPNCDNDLHVEYTQWEYPMNWISYDELEAEGGSIVQEKPLDKYQTTLD
jgi:predicted nucleic acid-binding protein